MDFVKEIQGYTLEYFDAGHLYAVDGVIVPSITEILGHKFGRKYAHVNKEVLQRAADKGTAVHNAIEAYCRTGEECDLLELRNFKFLQKQYGFKVLQNETPVILFLQDKPIAAGRLDMVIETDKVAGADIKRTSSLDKEYVAYQLNLYRIAYRQCYGVEWEDLYAIHLRENVRKFVPLPINEGMAWQLVHEYLGANNGLVYGTTE